MSKPGDETQAYCTSCKTMREHIIVAMVGDKPAKVECDECHKQHLYRANPPGVKKPGAARAKKLSVAAAKIPPMDIAAAIAGREPRSYDPKVKFAVGDVVRHPSFGVGIVVGHAGAQKMDAAFPDGQKLLSHDRGAALASPLARPPRREDDERKLATDAPPAPRAR